MSAFGGTADMLGVAPNRRVRSGNMELEKARARRSISNTQSVLIVKAKIYGLTRREYNRLPIHDKLQRAFKYDEHAFRIGMVMQAGNSIFFVDHDHRVAALGSDRIVIYKINAGLFLLRQINDRCRSALSDRECALKARPAPAIRLRGCDDLDDACRRAAVILEGKYNAFLQHRECLCGEAMPIIGCGNRACTVDHEQVAVCLW